MIVRCSFAGIGIKKRVIMLCRPWRNGQRYFTQILINSWSEASFISQNLLQIYIYFGYTLYSISGLTKQCGGIEVPSSLNTNYNQHKHDLNNLSENLPSHPKLCLKNLGFTLADTQFYTPMPMDILIGSDIHPNIISYGIKRNILGSLLAQEIDLEWVLFGPTTQPSRNSFIPSWYPEQGLLNLPRS